MERFQDERGFSARHLVLMFLAAVAVCAVFFSLGFVVGYNHSPSKATPVTENVSGSRNIPPTVNPPAGEPSHPSSQGMETENVSPGSASIPKPEHPHPLPPEPVATAQIQAQRPPVKSVPQKAPRSKPPAATQERSAPSATSSSGSHFAVQVMASRTRADAVTLVTLLKSHGFQVFILSPQQSPAKDNLYRVQVGPFATRAQAVTARHKLEGEGFRPFIVH